LGSPSGTWNYYFEDSTLWKKEFVSNDTTYLRQYFTESIPHQETVKMGNGQVVTHYKTGGIKESYTFKNGLREGAFYENLASGKTSIQGEFLKGKKNGLWQYFFASGQVEMIQHFNWMESMKFIMLTALLKHLGVIKTIKNKENGFGTCQNNSLK
jgi:antitoxin component YwqK of YwqJK toxin-antitoxin module